MKIATKPLVPAFTPVEVTIICESQKELDTLTAIASRTVKIPDAMFEHDSRAVNKLLERGISRQHVIQALSSLFHACYRAGGQP